MPPPRTTIFFMGLSDFKRYQGNGRQQQRHDPETGDDLGFEETLFLVVMVQGGHEQNAASFAVFAFGVFEVAHLKHDREALDQEDAAEKGQQQLLADAESDYDVRDYF